MDCLSAQKALARYQSSFFEYSQRWRVEFETKKRKIIMKKGTLIAIGVMAALVGLVVAGCKKKTSQQDVTQYHTAEGAFKQIQDLRLQLTEALTKKDLQYVHDSMYYFKHLLTSLSSKLEGEKKQRVDAVLKELTKIADEIDNSAGRRNEAATEANLQKLIDTLKGLEGEFKDEQKK